MKIALITKAFDPVQGGCERYGYNLATSLAQMGHQVHVFGQHRQTSAIENLHLHLLPQRRCPWHSKPLALLQAVNNCLNRQEFDVSYAITPCYPVDAYRAGDGVQRHWLRLKYPHPLARIAAAQMPSRRQLAAIERQIYASPENCREIIVNSQLVKQHIQQYHQVAGERIHVVYNGVDQSLFHPRERQHREQWLQQHHIPPERLVILFVANNWQRKGLATLLLGAAQAMQRRQAVVVVIGRGKIHRWRKRLQQLAINSAVFFIPATAEIVSWYCGADVLVLPTRYDPFANVCLEAMACGLPVITTAANGASELIRPGVNGYILANCDDHCQLQNYLSWLVPPEIRNQMNHQALITARKFTLEKNASETLTILERLAK